MSNLFRYTPTDGCDAVWQLVLCLLDAGWTKVQDSDGTTYSSSGAQVTGAGAGAHGLKNAKAYVVLRQPDLPTGHFQTPAGGHREILIQRDPSNGDTAWRLRYSRAAGFAAGGGTATVTPSATDGQNWLGGGTDSVPTAGTLFPANGTYRWNVIAGSSTSGYGFCGFGWITGGSAPGPVMLYDSLLDGTFVDADVNPPQYETDPYVLWASYNSTKPWQVPGGALGGTSSVGQLPQAWVGAGTASPTYGNIYASYPSLGDVPAVDVCFASSSATLRIGPGGQNPWNSKDVTRPVPWITGGGVRKGYSSFLRWNVSAPRTAGRVGSWNTSNDRVALGSCVLPWDGGAELL